MSRSLTRRRRRSALTAVLVAGTPAGDVRVWRTVDRTLVEAVQGHTDIVWGLAVSGDGRLVACGGDDGLLRLWDPAGGTWRRTLRADRRNQRMEISGLTRVTAAQLSSILKRSWCVGAHRLNHAEDHVISGPTSSPGRLPP